MLTLDHIQLVNFRAVQDATLSPLTEGITGLSGPNGVGKSAFLEGMLWAMFGVVPDGVTQANLRRQQSSNDEPCYVEVHFWHSGQKVVVKRELKGKKDNAVLNITLDGEEANSRAVSSGQQWITARLGVDGEGFTTAVLVPQKDLDDIVSNRPATRRELIERLAGIEPMNAALKSARTELNAIKSMAEGAVGSQEEIDAAAVHVEQQEVELVNLKTVAQSATDEVETVRASAAVAVANYDTLQTHHSALQQARTKVDSATLEVDNTQSLVVEAEQRLARAEGSLWEGATRDKVSQHITHAQESVSKATGEAERINESISKIVSRGNDVAARIGALDNKVEGSQRAVTQFTADINRLTQAVENFSDNTGRAEKDAKRAATALQQVRTDLSRVRHEGAELAESLRILTSSDHSQCPTCHSHLPDPAVLIASIESSAATKKAEAEELESQESRLTAEYATAQKEESQARRELETHRNNESTLAAAAEGLEQAKETLLAAQDELRAKNKEREALLVEYKEGAALLTKAQEAAQDARTELSRWQDTSGLFDEKDAAEQSLNNYKARAKVAQEAVATHQAALIASQEEAPTDSELEEAYEQSSRLQSAVTQALTNKERADGDVRVQEERVRGAKSEHGRQKSDFDRKKALLETVQQKTATSHLLDEFRKNQIARIAPELSETATSLISSMTNGFYTEVKLDENFTPSVVSAEGETRPASWLSGGEVSVLALALRIAIGDLVSGGEGGLLFLDEVLVAQDADRRQSLIETLRTLNGRQIVMINHTQGAEDILDKSIRLRRSDAGGTIVDES